MMNSRSSHGLLLCCAVLIAGGAARGPAQPKQAPVSPRVEKLVSQMTLEEKIGLLHGSGEDASTYQGQAGYLAGVPRLGIPSLRLADGPPGVLTRVPASALTATMGLAATFSREDARANGIVVANQATARGVDVALQPFINIARDFEFGRAYNTYGEDPFLTGQIGAEFIRGVQDRGVMAQAKHYIGYDTDGTEVSIAPQALHEIYAAPFQDAIDAGVSSIMCSYNKINGEYACGNNSTLNDLFKGEMGFTGFVTSDWGATHATDFILSGLDMEMPGPLPVTFNIPSYFVKNPPREEAAAGDLKTLSDGGLPEEKAGTSYSAVREQGGDLLALVKAGVVPEKNIDQAVIRILSTMERFGLLDGKSHAKVSGIDSPEDAAVIERTSTDAAVLLKNEGGILPLKPSSLAHVALIGPGAAQVVAVGLTGEKAVGIPERQVGPLAALRKLGGNQADFSYAPADDMDGVPVPAALLTHFGEPGLERRVFKEDALRIDSAINFTKKDGTALAPDQSIVWTGTLNVPETGNYRLHLQLLGCWGSLKIDEQPVARTWYNWIHGEIVQAGQDNVLPTTDGLDNLRAEMYLTAGPHRITIEANPDSSHQPMQMRFNWVTPIEQKQNHNAAIEAAKHADTAIVFVWSRLNPVFQLPGDQDKLIQEIAAVNPNTVVVLNVSQPVMMPWLDKVKAVLQMWWSGDEGGWATAKLLLGTANPSGRLPFTWPRRPEDTPALNPAHRERTTAGTGGQTEFSEGIFVGYRWFDQQKIEPLFPFGFGLSYTHFEYSHLTATPASDGGAEISFVVKNDGATAGDEVAQVYLDAPSVPPAGAQFAVRALAGFDRVHLQPGESKTVTVRLPPRRFQYWSAEKGAWARAAGKRTIEVGASSRDTRLHTSISVSQ